MPSRNDNLYLNASGCKDPTAFEAIKSSSRVDQELERKANDLVRVLKYIVKTSGFDLIHRIEIKDKETGKEFR